jgi:hypothetical protein
MQIFTSLKQKKLFKKANDLYGEYYQQNITSLNELLVFMRKEFDQIVVWGAGLKGKSFLAQCDSSQSFVDFVVDTDKKKQNKPLLTGHMVYGIDTLKSDNSVILVANVKFFSSICFDLINNGFDIKQLRIICLDDFLQGKYTLHQIKDNTIWERKRYYD